MDTNGHIDNLVRFYDDAVLIMSTNSRSHPDYDKLKNSLSSELDFAGDLNSSSEMKLHLATVLIKKVLSKLEN